MSNAEISCENCTAACCKGDPFIIMQLSKRELKFMKRPGNQFQTIVKPADHVQTNARYPVEAVINRERNTVQWVYMKGRETEPLPAGMGRYALVGACKYLEKDENGSEYCGVYERRPQVCQDFEMGSPNCETLRELAGVPIPVELIAKPEIH